MCFRNVLLSQTEYFFLSILISIISLLIFLSLSFHCISRPIVVCIYESQNGSQNTAMDHRILLLYLPNREYTYTMDDMQLRTKIACLCMQWLGWGVKGFTVLWGEELFMSRKGRWGHRIHHICFSILKIFYMYFFYITKKDFKGRVLYSWTGYSMLQ